MATMNRPLSPHIQIYKPQLTSALSILHRATGILLALGAVSIVYWLLALASGPEAHESARALFGSLIGRTVLFFWVFALSYHLSNGIRHFFWDAGKGFEIGTVYASGITVIIASVVMTLAVFAAAYALRGGIL